MALSRSVLINYLDMQTFKNTMPKSFVSSGTKRDTDAALRRAERDLNVFVSRLEEMREIPELPTEIRLINEEFIKEAITPRMEAVKNDLGLNEDERDERLKMWKQISNTASKYVNSIKEILLQWPDVQWKWNSEENYYIAANAPEVVDKRSTFDVPEEAREHYQLIHNALAAVKELREWERTQDAKTVSLITLVRLTPAQIAEAWHTGDARIDHRYDHLGIRHDDFNGTIII